MRKPLWIAGVIGCLCAAAITAFFFFGRPAPKEVSASYVDAKLCANCHADIAKSYRQTGMGRSFYRPNAENTPGGDYFHKPSESYLSVFERGGKLYQRPYQKGFDGKPTNELEEQIDYVLGSGNHVRAYLHRTARGTLIELPLAWYSEKGGSWAMNPGYDRPDDPGFSRNINYACVFCHNAYPQIPANSAEPGAEPRYEGNLPEGIDCQRCHGPGGNHVTAAEAGANADEIRAAIVNPARLSKERQMEVCMQCHLETTSFRLPNSIVRFERSPFSYRPGEPLSDFMLQFDKANASDDRFEIAGAAYRLRRSECFLKSEGALSCTTCHNPHSIPRGEEAKQHYTAICRQCHEQKLKPLIDAAKHTADGDCIGCHMPKRRTDDVVHAVMTDHYIQRRKPDRDLLAPLAERRETEENSYRGEVALYYPRQLKDSADADLYSAVAQVSQSSNLAQGIPELTEAIEKHHPERMEFYLYLGDALRQTNQAERAIAQYQEALRRKPESPAGLQRLGIALRAAGRLAESAEALKHATVAAPTDATVWQQLALTYLAESQRTDAKAALERSIELDPDLQEAYNNLGGMALEDGDPGRAQTAFRKAIAIQPDFAEARANLGAALSASGEFPEARYHFEAAIRLKPDYAAAHLNYAIALARVHQLDAAQQQAQAALKADPNLPEAHDLLGNLLAEKNQFRAAIDHYREALRLRPGYARALLDMGETLADSGDIAGSLPYLQQAAASPQRAVSAEASQALRRLSPRQ